MFLVQWLRNCKDITNAPRTVKETHNDFIRFSFKEAEATDNGVYFIVARNKHGVDKAYVQVTVSYVALIAY